MGVAQHVEHVEDGHTDPPFDGGAPPRRDLLGGVVGWPRLFAHPVKRAGAVADRASAAGPAGLDVRRPAAGSGAIHGAPATCMGLARAR